MADGVDFIIRGCRNGSFMPIIEKTTGAIQQRLYHGDHHPTIEQAFRHMVKTWNEKQTGHIIDYKPHKPLRAQRVNISLRLLYDKHGYAVLRSLLDQWLSSAQAQKSTAPNCYEGCDPEVNKPIVEAISLRCDNCYEFHPGDVLEQTGGRCPRLTI